MTAKQFQKLQSQIGMDNNELAALFTLHAQSISRFRTGAQPIPGAVGIAMKALATGWRP